MELTHQHFLNPSGICPIGQVLNFKEYHMLHVKAEDLAHGRWPDILAAAGLDSTYLRHGKGGPCPLCMDGKDRYSWSNKYGGVYVCRVCTGGKYRSGMDLLMRHMDYSFIEAANHVRSYFGINGSANDLAVVERLAQAPRREYKPDPQRSLARMSRQWNESLAVTPGDPVYQYLMYRVEGLTEVPQEIRYHPALEYWVAADHPEERPVLLGKFAAMLVRGFDHQDCLVQLHKTYLTPDGRKADVPSPKKTDVGIGSNEYALRLGVPSVDLGVSEGIETGLRASVRDGIPVWPCHSADIMANFVLPEIYKGVVKRLVIYTDSDLLKNGIRKGEFCAKKLADRCRSMGLRSIIKRPAKVGADFADM